MKLASMQTGTQSPSQNLYPNIFDLVLKIQGNGCSPVQEKVSENDNAKIAVRNRAGPR
jgi:hypothetical protein